MSNEEVKVKKDEETGDTIMQKPQRYKRAEPTMQELAAEEELKAREASTEDTNEEIEEQAKGPEDESFKKRYGDLRRHIQKTTEAKDKELADLKKQLATATKKEMKLPKTDEEIDKWASEYPDVAKIVETIATKKAMEASSGVEEKLRRVEELELKIEREKAETELARLHPDYDDLRQDHDFHNWVAEQPKWIQSALYENDTDFLGAAKAIDLYKAETGKKAKKEDKGAAKAVRSSKRSEELTESKNTWSESRVRKLSGADFERHQEEIEKAIRSGNFDYDLSGGAR